MATGFMVPRQIDQLGNTRPREQECKVNWRTGSSPGAWRLGNLVVVRPGNHPNQVRLTPRVQGLLSTKVAGRPVSTGLLGTQVSSRPEASSGPRVEQGRAPAGSCVRRSTRSKRRKVRSARPGRRSRAGESRARPGKPGQGRELLRTSRRWRVSLCLESPHPEPTSPRASLRHLSPFGQKLS